MKRSIRSIFTLVAFATVAAFMVASCNTAPRTDAAQTVKAIPDPDTTGLAQYQQWKAQNELANMQQYQGMTAAQPQTKTIVKYVPVRQASSRRTSGSGRSNSGTMSSESANTAKASQKKGWSKSAKGAVIGGVGGAAAGAVINKKNRALGAVIGGILGAGAGYGIGHGMDKKDGRF
jgi:hypothetical protein